jgi:hypothetical protein
MFALWRTAERQDALVAEKLRETRSCDQVVAIDDAAFFDELFNYLREIGLLALLEGLDPGKRKRESIPFLTFVLLSIMRSVGGVQSMLAMHDILLTDEALMALVGFNAIQVRDGNNARGKRKRSHPTKIRGALSYETVADNIVKIGAQALCEMFNGAIACLARRGVFPKKVDAVLDATDNEATPKYKTDAGGAVPSVTREKRPDVRANQHAPKVKVTVWGWKVWVVFDPVSKMPLALCLDGINEPDNKHAYAVLMQARKNLDGHAEIRSVALDRGFLDGQLLWQIDSAGIWVYIPGKANLGITQEARALARQAAQATNDGKTVDGCVVRERSEVITRGAGKNARKTTLRTKVVGIESLACDFWTAEGSRTSAPCSKKFEPRLLRATVVLCWKGAEQDLGDEPVLLTSDTNPDPFAAFDAYDDRSLIENTCNREAKETWFLERHPKRSEAGVRVQTYFVFLCMALLAAFRVERAKAEAAERRGAETGMSRYRRALMRENRDKVAVFIDDSYGVLHSWEFAVLAGIIVRKHAEVGDTVASILERLRKGAGDTS